MQMFLWACVGVMSAAHSIRPETLPGSLGFVSGKGVVSAIAIADTVKYGDSTIRRMVGKCCAQKDARHNNVYAGIISRLEASPDTFLFCFDSTGISPADREAGLVTYDGANIIIRIKNPGPDYETINSIESILYEETKHAEQFLDGETYFEWIDGCWQSHSTLNVEVRAKMFVVNHLKLMPRFTYTDTLSNLTREVPTCLQLMKELKNDSLRASFLKNGISNYTLIDEKGNRFEITIPPPYPGGSYGEISNPFSSRIKTNRYFSYPGRLSQ